MANKRNIIIVVVVILIALVAIPVGSYNSLIEKQTNVEAQSANIDTQLQRRTDLIPNLVETVKSFAIHETEVFDSVNQARAQLASATTMAEKSAANQEVTSALNRLIAVAEAYPDLKSDTVYIGLMDELAGTENRIANVRANYNEAVTAYNATIRRFPTVLLANMFGFERADFFEVAPGGAAVPEVNFE